MAVNYELRYACHPQDFKRYDTTKIRKQFLIENIFQEGNINLVYSLIDRYVVGGAKPQGNEKLVLETILPLKANYFLERRELGVINIGKKGIVYVDDEAFELDYKEALYVGKEVKEVSFKGSDALFYINSAPAHKVFPTKKISLENAEVVKLGSMKSSNDRKINKLIVNSLVKTCQLQMGMTELKEGSVWNTMPAHVHNRRMEVYFYFEVPVDQAICHFMGETDETRHIWMKNNQAVLSPSWSIHSAAGTSNYIFIWGMSGENLDYGDMDICPVSELK